jgi:tetratricopeptide (TPR) repeat protein
MPAGELFELIRPVFLLLAALLSIWILASARKRFSIYIAFPWAVGTLFLPLVVAPVYLAVILLWRLPARSRRWRFSLPLAYGAILLTALGFYFYRDSQSVDAHLARATQAKLVEDHAAAIREYRRALALEDNPHTHKLLAIELANDGQLNEAIAEFRFAEQGGEPISCAGVEPRCEEALKRIKGLSR